MEGLLLLSSRLNFLPFFIYRKVLLVTSGVTFRIKVLDNKNLDKNKSFDLAIIKVIFFSCKGIIT